MPSAAYICLVKSGNIADTGDRRMTFAATADAALKEISD